MHLLSPRTTVYIENQKSKIKSPPESRAYALVFSAGSMRAVKS